MDADTPNCSQNLPAQAIAAPQPLVSLQRGAQCPPQELPNLMSHLKSSTTSPSPFLALPSAGPSKPSSTAPVDIDPQSQAHADLLALLGIKVRDFAYESKLPPVQPYRVRQIQPGLRLLKRTRRDGEEVDDVFQDNTRYEIAEGSRKSKLKREDTEPDVTQHQPRRPRALGFYNIRNPDRDPDAPPWCQSQSQSQPAEYSQPSDFSQSQPLDSQDSEPYVVTPLVTPNGSLQWPDVATTSDIPASQLDTESQANDPVLLAYSQLGMPEPTETESQPRPESEPEHSDTTGTGLVGKLTPMSSLSSVGSDIAPKPLDPCTSNALSRSSTASPSPPTSTVPSTPTSRYQLRRRPIPPSPQSPTKSGMRDRKSMYKAAYSLPRPVAYSMQSSHAKAKAPVSRVTRTHESPSNRDETMVVR